jgi:NACHT domain
VSPLIRNAARADAGMMVNVPPRRWFSIAIPAMCFAAFAVWLVLQLSAGDLDRGDKLASIISMSITIVTLPLSVLAIIVTVRQGQSGRAVLTLAERLDAMAEALAIVVRAQWEAEERVRRIHDPFPLPARWTNAPDQLMDHWQTIHGEPTQLVLDGHGDPLVDTFHRIPSGRLVVLGRAGAGKTILTSRFVLTHLDARPLPVPVIVSLGSWDPTTHSLRAWLADQLVTTYPILAERDSSGANVAEQLLTTGRIMPVLDGFDEISEHLRVDAINAINAGLSPGHRLLLTSRLEEYAAAVEAGDVLTGAAVVCLEDLNLDDLARYLPLTTRRVHNGRNKWEPVLDHLRAGPSPLSEVLSTPLMVAHARAIFSDTNADPAELLTATSATELEERLLAGFVPAVYPGDRDVGRWLGFLATHLNRLGTYDLAWWQLALAVPRIVMGLIAGIAFTLAGSLMTGLLVWTSGLSGQVHGVWLVAWLGTGLLAGTAGGLRIGKRLGRRPPNRTYRKIPHGFGPILRWLAGGINSWRHLLWLAVWTAGGLQFVAAVQLIGASASGSEIVFGLGMGVVVGIAAWFIAVSVRVFGAWVDPRKTVRPAELLHADRTTAMREGLTVGICISTMVSLVLWAIFERISGLSFAAVYENGVWILNWLVIAAASALMWMLFGTMWGPWLIARCWLPLTRRIPWSILKFLADAHHRGVLRQAGGVYQFRHARLQDHLATPTPQPATAPPAHPPAVAQSARTD